MNRNWINLVLGIGWFLSARQTQADIFVPAEYPTIQAAIDAAAPGTVIHLSAGRYSELLRINKSLTLTGSGTNDCVLYYFTNVPIVAINGPGSVTLSNFEIVGGTYVFLGYDWYNGTGDYGITATNATLVLDTMVLNQIKNYFVTAVNCTIGFTNVALWTRNILMACDIGFELRGCTGTVSRVQQDAGHIDHTININNPPANPSDITIENCRIRTSSGSYGNCIRTYANSSVRITNCYLYRGAGETVPSFSAFNHSGISVNGYSNNVVITGNTISNVPWAMYCYGSPGLGGNRLLIENNHVMNSPIGGIVWDGMNYKGVDLGGGAWGSRGGNVFSQTPTPLTNFCADVLFTNSAGASSANIFALHNTWSNPTNKENAIYDKLDNATLGRLLTDDLILTPQKQSNGKLLLTWNERGAGEKYTVESRSDLTSGNWSNAPGVWPITNSGLNSMSWTNPSALSSNAFYRLRSLVP